MANLTGNVKDVTNQAPSTVVSITVKAPGVRIGSGNDLIVSSPAEVDFNHDTGALTLTGITGGLSWLVIEGTGWSDTVALSVADGMTTLVEAVANASGVPGMVDYVRLMAALSGAIDDVAQAAVDAAAENIVWSKGFIADADGVIEAGAGHTSNSTLNLPEGRSSSLGALETLQVGSTFSQRWTSWTTPYEVYRRSKRVSGGWYEWENAADEPWDNLGLVADTEAVTSPGAGYTNTGTTANLPDDAGTGLGSIEYFQVASTLYARWTAWGLTPSIYTRSQRSDGSWYPWVDITASDDDKPVARGSAGGLKTIPLALSTGHGNSSGGVASGSFRVPLNFAAPIVRWRLAFVNRNPRYGTIHDTTATVSKVALGKDAGGGKITSPVTVDTNVVVPANGDVAYTDWCNTPIDGAMLLGYKFTSTGSNTPPRLLGGGWDMGTADPASTAATGTRTSYVSFDMWVEAEVENGTPVIAAFGDSLTAGLHADVPVHDSWLSQYARGIGALPVHYAHSGDGANSWAGDLESYKWTRWAHLDLPDGVIYQLGSNDLSGDGDSVPTLKANTSTIVEHIAETITPNIYAGTITPRNSWDSATEAERTTYNAWLRTLPSGIRDVFDPASAVGNGASLKEEYQTDGTHLNTAGYGAWAGTITRKVVATPKMDRSDVPVKAYSGAGFPEGNISAPVGSVYTDTAATNGAIRWVKTSSTGNTGWRVEYGDTGWRDITSLTESGRINVGDGGYVRVRRTPMYVEYAFNAITSDSVGNLYSTPNGFRALTSQAVNGYTGFGSFVVSRFWLGTTRFSSGDSFNADREYVIRFNADPAWPSSLPGTPI